MSPAPSLELPAEAVLLPPPARQQAGMRRAFAGTAASYLATVLPRAGGELARWRGRAAQIPDRRLREATGRALAKRGNVEGAALFATLAPAAQRGRAVSALVGLQAAYNVADALSELPCDDPVANGAQLTRALLVAVDPGEEHVDYHAHSPLGDDGGYLRELVDACREAVAGLPSFATVAPTAAAAARRIMEYEAFDRSPAEGGHDELQAWARAATPRGSGVSWWETAAAAGSSLCLHALVAAAADPHLDAAVPAAIESVYFPWIGALHSLLDSLVDRREDRAAGRESLLDNYTGAAGTASRMAGLAGISLRTCERLPSPAAHRTIATAMASYYLSDPELRGRRFRKGAARAEGVDPQVRRRDRDRARAVAHVLRREFGPCLRTATIAFRGRRLARTATGRRYV